MQHHSYVRLLAQDTYHIFGRRRYHEALPSFANRRYLVGAAAHDLQLRLVRLHIKTWDIMHVIQGMSQRRGRYTE